MLCGLSLRLLADLKEARERLNQGPTNSSRPPSSRAPWERGEPLTLPDEAEASLPVAAEPAEEAPADGPPTEVPTAAVNPAAAKSARKPGKQPGAPGVGYGLTGLCPTRQRHRHLPAAQPLTVVIPANRYRRPPCRPSARSPAAGGG